MAIKKAKPKTKRKRKKGSPKPLNPKLYAQVKSETKRKFKVYPSAYANAYASKICAGKAKDPSGLRRKDFKGPKPAGKAGGGVIDTTKFTYV